MKARKSAGDLPRLNLMLPLRKEVKLVENTSRSSRSLPSPVSAAELVLLDETATTVTVAPAVATIVSTWRLGIAPPPFPVADDERDFREVSAQAFVRRIPVFLFNIFIATVTNEALQFSSNESLAPGNASILIQFLAVVIPCFVVFTIVSLWGTRYFRATAVRAVLEVCCVILLPIVILTRPLASAAQNYNCETSLFIGLYSFFMVVNILRPSKWVMFALTLVTSE